MGLFVTGVGSFIGGALLAACDRAGVEVTGIDTAPVDRPGCRPLDLRSPDLADAIPEDVDAVVHLAALSRDPDCRDAAIPCFDVNVMGTLNLMAAAGRRRARQFIFASSEWVYDSFPPGVEKTEDDPIDALAHTSEYAFSKLVGEVNLRQKFRHGFCPTTILRFGIVYGPRRTNWSAVETLVNAVATRDTVNVGSRATARRFIHVADVAEAVLAARGLEGCTTINIQGPRLVSLGEILDRTGDLLGRKPAIEETAPDRPSIRGVSSARAEALMGWRARVGIEEGLRSVTGFLCTKGALHDEG